MAIKTYNFLREIRDRAIANHWYHLNFPKPDDQLKLPFYGQSTGELDIQKGYATANVKDVNSNPYKLIFRRNSKTQKISCAIKNLLSNKTFRPKSESQISFTLLDEKEVRSIHEEGQKAIAQTKRLATPTSVQTQLHDIYYV